MKTLQDIQTRAATLQCSSSSRDLSEAKCLIALVNGVRQLEAESPSIDETEAIIKTAKTLHANAVTMNNIYEKIPSAVKMLAGYKVEIKVYASYIPVLLSYEEVLKNCSAYSGKTDEENFLAWCKRQNWYWNTSKDDLIKVLATLTI